MFRDFEAVRLTRGPFEGVVFVRAPGGDFTELWTGEGPKPAVWVGRRIDALHAAAGRPERVS